MSCRISFRTLFLNSSVNICESSVTKLSQNNNLSRGGFVFRQLKLRTIGHSLTYAIFDVRRRRPIAILHFD